MPAPQSVPLGPFDLLGPLGAGGMGEVFRARHRTQSTPVAIKVMVPKGFDVGRAIAAFTREVRAVASLTHPGIVAVYDYGTIDASGAAASRGRMAEGSPYLAMELAQGTLADRPPSCWTELREVIVDLTMALGHAHARQVLHRDVKPTNVLRTHGRILLTDFGLASIDREGGTGTLGTPAYMAPEQVDPRPEDQGPWTDLYALSAMIWELCTGRRVFDGNLFQVLRSHLFEAPGPFQPRYEVPDGLEAWLRRCLHKNPFERFEFASDARAALEQLKGGFDSTAAPTPTSPVSPSEPTLAMWLEPQLPRTEPAIATAPPRAAPTPPSTWQARTTSGEAMAGALGLWGLRRVPMVGRLRERDALWEGLLSCTTQGQPSAIVLRGPPGQGKSFLARWLCERAHETGAATVLRATHSEEAGAADGLRGLLNRAVRAGGLDRPALLRRLGRLYPDDVELGSLIADVLTPSPQATPGDAVQAVVCLARAWSRRRPVVVWLDDVQWGDEAADLARRLLDATDHRILVLLTLRDPAECPIEGDRVQTLELKPLSAGATARFLSGLLSLRREAVEQVVQRSAGTPLFAVQLITDWLERGLLEVSDGGFAVREGADLGLPEPIFDLWSRRLGHVLADQPTDAIVALELAAHLGNEVDLAELAACCELASVDVLPERTLDALARQGLVIQEEAEGFRFVHGLLAQTLTQQCVQASTTHDRRRAVAEGLLRLSQQTANNTEAVGWSARAVDVLHGVPEDKLTARVALMHGHCLLATRHDAAVRALRRASEIGMRVHPRAGAQATTRLAAALAGTGRHAESLEVARRAVSLSDDPALQTVAYQVLALALFELGEIEACYDAAHQQLAAALEVPQGSPSRPYVSMVAMRSIAQLEYHLGHVDKAIRTLEQTNRSDAYQTDGQELDALRAAILTHTGQGGQARPLLEGLANTHRASGHHLQLSRTLVNLALCVRANGESEEAILKEALELMRHIGSRSDLANAHRLIAETYESQSAWPKVDEHLDAARITMDLQSKAPCCGLILAALATAAHRRGDLQAALELGARGERTSRASAPRLDYAKALCRYGHVLHAAGRDEAAWKRLREAEGWSQSMRCAEGTDLPARTARLRRELESTPWT